MSARPHKRAGSKASGKKRLDASVSLLAHAPAEPPTEVSLVTDTPSKSSASFTLVAAVPSEPAASQSCATSATSEPTASVSSATSVPSEPTASPSPAASVSREPTVSVSSATSVPSEPTSSPSSSMVTLPPSENNSETKRTERLDSQVQEVTSYIYSNFKIVSDWVWSLRVPLSVLLLIAVMPKLVVALWILLVLLKPGVTWLFFALPENVRQRILTSVPESIRGSSSVEDLSEGLDQARPFILFWTYLCCAPFAIGWMAIHWFQGLRQENVETIEEKDASSARLIFKQNSKTDDRESANNFYHSRAFALTLILFFALGIPAFFSMALYQELGIDHMVQSGPALRMMPQITAPPEADVPVLGLSNTFHKGHGTMGPSGNAQSGSHWVTGYQASVAIAGLARH